MANKNSLVRSAFSLSFLTLLSRILGLVREMTKSRFLGTSVYADAFVIAFMIPNLFRRLFAENSISVAFIPTFREYLARTDENAKNETLEFVGSTLTLVSFLTAIVVSLGILFAPAIVPFFCKGGEPAVLSEMTILTRIMFPYLFVISVAAFFQGILNGVKIFSPSGFTPILFNLIVIFATYILTPIVENPARAMSIGVTAGGIVQAVFQLPFVVKSGWWSGFRSLKKAFTNKGTRKVCKLILPTLVGMAAYQLNDAVSTALAGSAATGTASSLQYSLRLQELILGIFAVSIGSVILPDLSALAKTHKWADFNKMLVQAMKIIALISIPVTFFSLVTGKEIVSLIYKSKNFDDESVFMTLKVFRLHIAGLFFIALNRIVSPAFYAQGDTKSPTVAGIIGFAINIAIALSLVGKFGGDGIAFALSAASAANTVLLLIFMSRNKKIDIFSVSFGTLFYSAKLTVFSLVAAYPTVVLHDFLTSIFEDREKIFDAVNFFSCGILFFAVGIFLLAVSRDESLKIIFKKIRRA